jgi:hypothetical protein
MTKRLSLICAILFGTSFYLAVGLRLLELNNGFELFATVVSSPVILIQSVFHILSKDGLRTAMKVATFFAAIAIVGSQVYFSIDYGRWKKRNKPVS